MKPRFFHLYIYRQYVGHNKRQKVTYCWKPTFLHESLQYIVVKILVLHESHQILQLEDIDGKK